MKSEIFFSEAGQAFFNALQVRDKVFTQEQGFAADLDHDNIDKTSWHVVIYDKDLPIATGRMFENKEENCYQIGRVAVLSSYRGQSLGRQVMKRLMIKAEELSRYNMIVLHAQTHALTFYELLGYCAEGEQFFEDGEPHIRMRLEFPLPANIKS